MSQNCVAEAGGDFWGHLVSPLLHGATQSSWPGPLSTSPRYAHHLSLSVGTTGGALSSLPLLTGLCGH